MITGNNGIDDQISIRTGSGATTITGNGANDVVSVDAGTLLASNSLSLIGTSAFTVTDLAGNLNAASASGAVSATGTSASQRLNGGSGADFFDGGAGSDTLYTPISKAALQARGVTVTSFETIVIDATQGHLSPCF